jgi:hypothetical protein
MRPTSQPPTKPLAQRLLLVWVAAVLGWLGFSDYLLVMMERGRGVLRESIVAMNDPDRLATFERAAQSDRLFTTAFMAALLLLAAMLLAVAFNLIADREKARTSS